jgi:hypothetical protein
VDYKYTVTAYASPDPDYEYALLDSYGSACFYFLLNRTGADAVAGIVYILDQNGTGAEGCDFDSATPDDITGIRMVDVSATGSASAATPDR